MKKIIMLSIGLMSASVHVAGLNADLHKAEIAQMATALAQDSVFVAHVRALCAQGLTAEQIAAQLMKTDEARAYAGQEKDEQHTITWSERSYTDRFVAMIVLVCLITANVYSAMFPSSQDHNEDYY